MRITNTLLIVGTAALLTLGITTRAQATAAPPNITGKTVFLAFSSGSGPFSADNGLAIAAGTSGSGFTLIGAGSSPMNGTYSYINDGGLNGSLSLNVGSQGQYQLSLHFTSDYQGTFVLSGSQGGGSGTFTYFSAPVPASMVSTELDLSPNPETGYGLARIVTSASGSSYAITNSSTGTVQSTGTYAYSRVNPCLGKLVVHDSVHGTGTAFFGFYAPNTGRFGMVGDPVSDMVTCTLLDRQAPTVTITGPAANARVLDLPVQVLGTASDNSTIASITYTLQNANGTSSPRTANGTTSWSASIADPVPGLNTITVTAVDADGNASAPVSRTFTYVASSALTVQSTGGGSFSPSLDGQFLEIGKAYTITAKPDTGYIFAGWTGEVSSSAAALTFTMRSNLVLQATFVPNPFPAVAGSYNGMFPSYDTNSASFSARALCATPPPQDLMSAAPNTIGSVSLAVTSKGSYSGKVRLGGATYSVSGQFDAYGFATKTITPKTGAPLTLSLELDLANKAMLRGSIGDGTTWVNNLAAARCTYSTKSATPLAGFNYTFVLPTALETSDAGAPTGYAYGTVSISPAGAVKLTGSLSDGTPITQGSTLAEDGSWPLCLPLYKGVGVLAGWVVCETNQLNGQARWFRPADAAARYFKQGLDFQTELISSRYVPSSTGILNFTNGLAEFRDGNLVQGFTNTVELVPGPKLVNHSINKLTLTFTKPSGLFSGSVNPPDVKRSIPFKGVVLQSLNVGAGYFLGTNAPGAVTIGPAE